MRLSKLQKLAEKLDFFQPLTIILNRFGKGSGYFSYFCIRCRQPDNFSRNSRISIGITDLYIRLFDGEVSIQKM